MMRLSILIPIALGFLLFSIIQACDTKNDVSNSIESFNQEVLFESLANTVVLPAFQNFVNQADALLLQAKAFEQSATSIDFKSLQTQWEITMLAAKQLEVLKFGTLNESRKYTAIHQWPVKESFIEGFISSTDSITIDYVATKGSTAKGLGTIEYLLFQSINNQTSYNQLISNQRRMDYLLSTCYALQQTAVEALALWIPESGNYAEKYAQNLTSGLSGSLSLTVNEMSSFIEYAYFTKVGKPLGTDSGNGIDTSLCEAYRGKASTKTLVQNLTTFKILFNGGKTESDIGFDDFLDQLEAKYENTLLSKTINQKIDEVLAELHLLNVPLSEALVNKPQGVEAVHTLLKELTVLLKVDFASALSITTTFSDNDGD